MASMEHKRAGIAPLAGSRRQFVGGAVGMAASLAALGRVVAQDGTPDATASPAAGEWAFTDSKGVTVTLPTAPQRIVADVNAAAPLWDFGIRPVALFGWNATENGDLGPAGGNIDPTGIAIVGNLAEPIQPERVIAADPDILITLTWNPDDPTEYWSIDPTILDQVTPIAPLIAISAGGSADANTETFADLAAALGADIETPELTEAKAEYEAALAAFPIVAAEKQDLTVLFVYAADESIMVAHAPDWADLSLYRSLGLNIIIPEVEDGSYWERLSMEEALKYPTDVVLHSSSPGTLTPEEMAAHPILGLHPAIMAGQVGPWNQDFIMSYQGMHAALTTILTLMRDAIKAT